MQVQYFMTPEPVTIDEDELVDAARESMHNIDVRHLPVVHKGQLVGIVSLHDIANATVTVLGLPVSSVMSSPPLTVGPTDDLIDAARTMLARKVSGIPVVDQGMRLVGMITTTNCLVALIQLAQEMKVRDLEAQGTAEEEG